MTAAQEPVQDAIKQPERDPDRQELLAASARRGWIVVAAAFVVMFSSLGALYAFPAFFSALQQDFAASRAQLSWVFSGSVALYFAIGIVSGPLTDRLGARPVVLGGITLVGLSLIGAGMAHSLAMVALAIGLGVGLGIGFSYVPAVSAVQRWFLLRRGFASGIAVSGIGLGTLIMPKVAEYLVMSLGWRGAYTVLGLFVVLAGGAAALFVDNSPEKRGMAPDGKLLEGPLPTRNELPGMTLGETVRSSQFRIFYAASVLASVGLFIPFVHLTPSAQDRGIDASTAVTLFALIGIGSTAGRFLIGGVADRMGRRRSLSLMFFGLGLMMGWWIFAYTAIGLAVFALVFGLCYGGYVALAPALLVDMFGPRNASGVIGVSYTAGAVGALLGPPLAGYAFDLTHSYTTPIAAAAVLALISAWLIHAMPEPHPAG